MTRPGTTRTIQRVCDIVNRLGTSQRLLQPLRGDFVVPFEVDGPDGKPRRALSTTLAVNYATNAVKIIYGMGSGNTINSVVVNSIPAYKSPQDPHRIVGASVVASGCPVIFAEHDGQLTLDGIAASLRNPSAAGVTSDEHYFACRP